jgi:hypothetical protein
VGLLRRAARCRCLTEGWSGGCRLNSCRDLDTRES